jgi:hypothetical protein
MEEHEMNEHSWEDSEDLPWESAGDEWEPSDTEAWRGDVHITEWPEGMAGPEYWLYKQENDDD